MIITVTIIMIIIIIAGTTSEEKGKFIQCHLKEDQACEGKFNFREQLMSYCSNDVTVLRLRALKICESFIELCTIDPFACVKLHLLIEILPDPSLKGGYHRRNVTAWLQR